MSYFEEKFNSILESRSSNKFYFYHLLPKRSDISKGILSLEYFYNHDIDKFMKYSKKYRDRLCDGWEIYPGRDPESLTADEIHDGINRFRNSEYGCNQIYLFRFPPYNELRKQMKYILNSKDIYVIDINRLIKDGIAIDIDYGYKDSYTGNGIG